MENLKYFIEKGSKKIGGITKLGDFLNITQPSMSQAKAGKRQLPMSACVVLANYINENPIKIIAYSQLTTETDVEKIQIWKNLLEKEETKAEKVIFKNLILIFKEIRSNKNYNFLNRFYKLFKKVVKQRNSRIQVIFHKMSVAFSHFYGRMT